MNLRVYTDLEVSLCNAIERRVPDPVIPVRDLLGDFLERLRNRRLEDPGAVAANQMAQLVETLGALLGVLGREAGHEERRHLTRGVDLTEKREFDSHTYISSQYKLCLAVTDISHLPDDALDAVPDGILRITHLVDEVRHKGDCFDLVHLEEEKTDVAYACTYKRGHFSGKLYLVIAVREQVEHVQQVRQALQQHRRIGFKKSDEKLPITHLNI